MLDFLRPSVPISKSFMRIPRISGIICGIWPRTHHSFLRFILFTFSAFLVGLGAIGENLYGFLNIENLVDALEAFCPGVTNLVCLCKMLVFFFNNGQWFDIVQRLRNMIMAEQRSSEKIKIVEKLASIGSIFSFILVVSGTITNLCFNLIPLVANFFRYINGEALVHKLPFTIAIPEIFAQFPLFPLTFGTLTLSSCMTVFAFSFVDGFYVCACMYMCGIFGMIQYDIRKVFTVLSDKFVLYVRDALEKSKVSMGFTESLEYFSRILCLLQLQSLNLEGFAESATATQNKRIHRKLGEIVERHNAIIDLCTDFTANFTLIIILHFLSAAFVLCSSILCLMLNSASLGLILYIFYSITALTQLFLYCIGGNAISESSAEVADVLYDVEWYKCDAITRKMILMMMRRSQKAKTISVPFFTPSLVAFSSIISTTGSYVTLLKTFL